MVQKTSMLWVIADANVIDGYCLADKIFLLNLMNFIILTILARESYLIFEPICCWPKVLTKIFTNVHKFIYYSEDRW